MNVVDQKQKTLTGTILRKSGINTYAVLVTTFAKHYKYSKVISKKKKFIVHSIQEFEAGALVNIAYAQKMSKRKAYIIV